MMADIGTVMWKEWKEILNWGGSRGKVGVLIFIGVFGIFLPLQMGRAWVESPMVLVYWAWVPLFLVTSVIADSFAGERERHTLETLLASRLSDWAILFGKVGSAVGYGVAITWLSLLLGLVTTNLAYGQGKLLLYPLMVGLGIVGLSLLSAGLAAGAGVLVSLRAATVRQAQQTLSIAIMVLLFVPIFGLRALPVEWKARLFETFMAMNVTRVVVIAVVILAVLNVGLLIAAMDRFRRAQLILN
jgi:ABC-2 type transport system permease protein